MEDILTIIAIVWSILNLVLFFKLWGMCNNVSEIKKILLNDDPSWKESFEDDARQIFVNSKDELDFNEQMIVLVDKYKKKGSAKDFDFPSFVSGMYERFVREVELIQSYNK